MVVDITVPVGDRNPFECPCCGISYSSQISSERAPCHLHGCWHAMCVRCVKETRTEVFVNGEKKYTVKCAVCEHSSVKEEDPQRALLLIDIISELETIQKKNPAAFKEFYVENDPLQAMYCDGCVGVYNLVDKWPFVLDCGHAMCANCTRSVTYAKRVKKRERAANPGMAYKVKCVELKCQRWTYFTNRAHGVHIEDVIKLLAKQREEKEKNEFSCCDCAQKAPCDRGFVCTSCTTNDEGKRRELCTDCARVTHKDHHSESLLPVKLQVLEDGCIEFLQSSVDKCNEDANEVADEHKALLREVEKIFSSSIDTIPSSSTLSDGVQIARSLKSKVASYEWLMQEIARDAKKQNKKLRDFINKVKPTEEEGSDQKESDGESKSKRSRLDGECTGEGEGRDIGEITGEGESRDTEDTEI